MSQIRSEFFSKDDLVYKELYKEFPSEDMTASDIRKEIMSMVIERSVCKTFQQIFDEQFNGVLKIHL